MNWRISTVFPWVRHHHNHLNHPGQLRLARWRLWAHRGWKPTEVRNTYTGYFDLRRKRKNSVICLYFPINLSVFNGLVCRANYQMKNRVMQWYGIWRGPLDMKFKRTDMNIVYVWRLPDKKMRCFIENPRTLYRIVLDPYKTVSSVILRFNTLLIDYLFSTGYYTPVTPESTYNSLGIHRPKPARNVWVSVFLIFGAAIVTAGVLATIVTLAGIPLKIVMH